MRKKKKIKKIRNHLSKQKRKQSEILLTLKKLKSEMLYTTKMMLTKISKVFHQKTTAMSQKSQKPSLASRLTSHAADLNHGYTTLKCLI